MGDISSIQVRNFTFDAAKKEMDIEMFLERIKFFEDLLTIRDTQLQLLATFTKSNTEANGIISLGDVDYAVNKIQPQTNMHY